MLIPRVDLTSATDVTTIPAPAQNLLVFNKYSSGSGNDALTPGLYYWGGSRWVAMLSNATGWSMTGNIATANDRVLLQVGIVAMADPNRC